MNRPDIRFPLGLLFSILGLLLMVFGLLSDSSLYHRSLGINVNFWWGLVLLVAGGFTLLFIRRAKSSSGLAESPAGPPDRFNASFIWIISLAAALGGLLFGYDWVVIGGAKPFFERYFGLADAATKGWANSCALIGCLAGALASGGLSDRYGRKRLLLLAACIFTVTSIGIGTSREFSTFVLWRIFGGVAIGLASNLSPMYISEVSPAHMRGKLVSVNQLTIVIGILLAQVVNYLIADRMPATLTEEAIKNSWNGQTGWRWMFAATAVPSAVFFVSMFFVPESPRWLAKNGKPERARRILARIGGERYAAEALQNIEATLVNETEKVDFRDLLDRRLRRVLALGVILAVFQQWCGINVIFNYAEEIFAAAGYNISDTLLNIAWTGTTNIIFTFVALGVVDRKGRRFLLLTGAAGLAVIYMLLGVGYSLGIQGLPMLLTVLAAIGCYAMSLAPVVWVVIAEIFPNRIRGTAMSVATASLWLACFILTYSFPILNARLGPAGTFWLYAVICIAGYVFVRAKLPETRGKTLEEIELELVDQPSRYVTPSSQ
jgi:sugar porter (SP) family MFS transporter